MVKVLHFGGIPRHVRQWRTVAGIPNKSLIMLVPSKFRKARSISVGDLSLGCTMWFL